MARKKREIEAPDLSSPPTADDFFDALKQILTPTSEELNTKYRLSRKKSTA